MNLAMPSKPNARHSFFDNGKFWNWAHDQLKTNNWSVDNFTKHITIHSFNSPLSHRPWCTLFTPAKFYITVVFDFAWDDCNTQEELETMVMQFFFGGWAVNKVQEPAIQSCDTGQQIAFFDSCQLTIIWISTITFCVYKHKLYLPWTRTEASKSRSL